MRSIRFVSSLLPILVAGPLAAQGFEGTIVTQIFSGGKSSSDLVTSYKGSKIRLELPGKEGGGYMLMNLGAGTWQTVMPEQKMYMTMKADDVDGKGKGKPEAVPKITATGKTETIAGHSCEHYLIADADGEEMDVCAAKGLGTFGFGNGPDGRGAAGSGAVPLEYRELASRFKDGFQPLKTERIRKGGRELVMQVKSIEKKALPTTMFEIPAGYKEFNVGGMMKGKLPRLPSRP